MDLGLLGPLQAIRRGTRVELGGAKQRLVLAQLAIRANRVVSVEDLIDHVWGEEPPEAARKSLHAYVSRLRRALGDDVLIERRSGGYVLRVSPSRIDAYRFEELLSEARRTRAADPEAAADMLERALVLWRGPALADLAGELSLQAEIARLEELRLTAIEQRFEILLGLGRHLEAVSELEAATREHPLRERLWEQLMLALYRGGRQADALAAYLRARTVLRDELGIDPSPELQQLHARILAQDEGLQASFGSVRSYELRERIGEGHFGVVYRAVQPQVGREVAVKVVHPRLARQPEFVRRLEVEAQTIARLEHPRIVPLYDYWRGPEGAFLVMRWMRGGSLRAAHRAGAVGPADAARVADQVAEALAVAHGAGVVHGDVTAENILLDEQGDAYLTDFAIAPGLVGGPRRERYQPRRPDEPPSEPGDQRDLALVLTELLGRDAANDSPLGAVLARAIAADPSERYPDVATFAAALREALGHRSRTRAGPAATNPYKGLRAFEEADHGDFYGRSALVGELLARLAEHGPARRFLAVVGASGSGKSSVVSAGLVPALRRGAHPGSERWFVATMYPGSDPFRELDAALLRVAVDAPSTLLDVLTRQDGGLQPAVECALPPDGSELVLVVDQLEELFTLVHDDEVRTAFLDALAAAAADPHSRVRIVVTLRADFYDRPLAHRRFAELLRRRTVVVTPLRVEEIEEAITEPARRAGIDVEPALVAAMIADVADQPGALPLLQYALTELFGRQEDGRMALAAYRSLGGIAGAVAQRADELYATLDGSSREAARQLFLRLVTLGEGTEDTRRRVPIGELRSLSVVDQSAMASVIQAYGHHRLLAFDRDPASREPTVEVAHEALLSAWDRLGGWLDDARDDLRAHRQLAAAAGAWLAGGRDPSDLWRGARLEHAESSVAAGTIALTDGERAFLAASTDAREAERAANEARRRHELDLERQSVRRLRALAAVLTAAVFGIAALTAFVYTQRQEAEHAARVATARGLATAAMAEIEADPDRGLLLAIEAVETTRGVDGSVLRQAEEALHAAVLGSRVVERRPPDEVVARTEDRAYEATMGPDGLTVRAAEGGDELVKLPEEGTWWLAVSPDRRFVAVGAIEGWPRVWDMERGTYLPAWDGGDGYLIGVAFDAEGTHLAAMTVGEFEGEVRVWELPSGAETFRASTLGSSGGGQGFSWSPTERRLAVAAGEESRIYAPPDAEPVLILPGDGNRVLFGPDGSRILTMGFASASLWDAATGERLHELPDHVGWVHAHAFSPDGRLAATGGDDGMARVWDVESGDQVHLLAGQGQAISALRFSPDGKRLESVSGGGTVTWDVTPAGRGEVLAVVAQAGPRREVFNVTFDPSGARLAAAGMDGTARVWDAATGALELELVDHEGPVTDIVFSADGGLIATSSFDGTARLWRTDGTAVRTLSGHRGPVWSVHFSPDGTRLLTTSEDQTARIWDVASGDEIAQLVGHRDNVYDAAWSPAGSTIVSVGHDYNARVWDPETWSEVRVLRGHDDNVLEQAFSPDGARIATASFDGRAIVWDVETGSIQLTLIGHAGVVLDVESHPDGSRWATAGLDGFVRLHDATTGQEVLELFLDPQSVGRLAFSPDGRYLAAAGGSGIIHVLTLDVEELLDVARARTTRALTDEECRQYLDLQRCAEPRTAARQELP